jgi:hypothetical protein
VISRLFGNSGTQRLSWSSRSSTSRYTERNVKRWQDGDTRKRWTVAGMLVAEQQFRRIIGYRDLATLVMAVERPPCSPPNRNPSRAEVAEPVTV